MKFSSTSFLSMLAIVSGVAGYFSKASSPVLPSKAQQAALVQIPEPKGAGSERKASPTKEEFEEDQEWLNGERRPRQSESLADSPDAEGAARTLMKCIDHSPSLFSKFLAKLDLPALQRLLADATEVRFRSILEAFILVESHKDDPSFLWEEGFRMRNRNWNYVQTGALELKARDFPVEAMKMAESMPETSYKGWAMGTVMESWMKQDQESAIQWIQHNETLADNFYGAISIYLTEHKDALHELAMSDSPVLRGRAIEDSLENLIPKQVEPPESPVPDPFSDSPPPLPLVKAESDPNYYTPALSFLRSLPAKSRDDGIRWMAQNCPISLSEPHGGEFFSMLTPEERPVALDFLILTRIEVQDGKIDTSWMGALLTPEDKKHAATVLPYHTGLSSEQKAELLKWLTSE